jgi:hypothetical protein
LEKQNVTLKALEHRNAAQLLCLGVEQHRQGALRKQEIDIILSRRRLKQWKTSKITQITRIGMHLSNPGVLTGWRADSSTLTASITPNKQKHGVHFASYFLAHSSKKRLCWSCLTETVQ